MNMIIQAQGFKLTRSLESYTREQITKAVGNCSEKIERVVVRLKDINGPRGGIDKHCSVEIKLSNQPVTVVKKTSADMYTTVHRTASRAARTALRQLKRRRVIRFKQNLKSKRYNAVEA